MSVAGRRLVSWLPVVAWGALIFALSSTPNLRFAADPNVDFDVRKIGHAGVFGVLALLLWRALAVTTPLPRPWAWAIGLTGLYAASDELHQGFTAGRHPALTDVGIDTLGALLLVAGTLWILGRRRAARDRGRAVRDPT